MSAWGIEPFQNDDALDCRDEMIERIAKGIDADLQSRGFVADDLFSLHGTMEILRVIVQECGNVWLKVAMVTSWKKRVAALDIPEGNDLVANLRQEVLRTLSKFSNLS